MVQGDFVWIEPPAGEGIPVGARVLDQDHGRLRIVDDLGQVSDEQEVDVVWRTRHLGSVP